MMAVTAITTASKWTSRGRQRAVYGDDRHASAEIGATAVRRERGAAGMAADPVNEDLL
jgi:hypothetical protein